MNFQCSRHLASARGQRSFGRRCFSVRFCTRAASSHRPLSPGASPDHSAPTATAPIPTPPPPRLPRRDRLPREISGRAQAPHHEAVASLVNYPLLVTDAGKNIRSRAHCSPDSTLSSRQVRAAVLRATQDDVWGNSNGFMIGGGVIWFDCILPPSAHPDPSAPDELKKYPFKVITVNPPIH